MAPSSYPAGQDRRSEAGGSSIVDAQMFHLNPMWYSTHVEAIALDVLRRRVLRIEVRLVVAVPVVALHLEAKR